MAKKTKFIKNKALARYTSVQEALIGSATLKHLPVSEISFSSLNYRRHFDQDALDQFAAEIRVHGILSPLLVRMGSSNAYELIAGERRLRAARIAGLATVPALVTDLNDEMVCELQLAENLQRENPHPLHEALAINRMQQAGKTIDQIAARLGKSRRFIYSRIKLSELIESFQQILMAGKMGVQQAYDIARLSQASQKQIFEQYCTGWEEPHFQMPSNHVVSRFRCDLLGAPFDTADENLVPAAPACVGGPLNSATLHSLFPELANEAVCSGVDCYQSKVRAHFLREISGLVNDVKVDALVYSHSARLDELANDLDKLGNFKDLPRYSQWGINEVTSPVMPQLEEYDENDPEDDQKALEQYQNDLEDYQHQLQNYQDAVASPDCLTGLLITEKIVRLIRFLPRKQYSATSIAQPPTARQFKQALRDDALTVEIIQEEIDRVQAKEARSVELDREKVQLATHAAFIDRFNLPTGSNALTAADQVALRLIVFQSLDYHLRYQVVEALGLTDDALNEGNYFRTLAGLTDPDFAYMLRMALAGNSQSKMPGNINGWSLRAVATDAGIDVTSIGQAQQKIADARIGKVKQRLKNLQEKKEILVAANRSDQVYS